MGLRSPSNFHRSLLLSSLIATGCGDQGASPFWAFQHASVQEIDGVLTGYQVWEFYGKRWQRKQKEKHHICALVQSVSGTPDTLADCPDCETVFAVDLSVVETDCDGAINPVDFEGVTHFGFGLAPSDLSEANPYPAASMGWYLSWDGDTSDVQGFAWNVLAEESEDFQTGWVDDQEFILWSAYAWQL